MARSTPQSNRAGLAATIGACFALLLGACGDDDTSQVAASSTTGTTTSSSSTGGGADSCSLDGVTVPHGQSATFYTAAIVDGDTCAAVGETRGCDDGILSGSQSAVYATCSPLREALLAGGTVDIPEGIFNLDGGIELMNPVVVRGAGKDKTQLRFRLNRYQPSIRILSSDVSISALDLHVNLTESLSKFPGEGGRGEYGTAITMGRVLHTEAHEVVSNIRVEDILISREIGSFVAAAMTIVGRSQNVVVNNIDVDNHHSTIAIVHWGAHSSDGPNPDAYYRDGNVNHAPNLVYYESYHPHDIAITNVRSLDHKVSRFLIASSSYNLEFGHWSGQANSLLFFLPGDENNDFAIPSDAPHVHSNIHVHDMDVGLIARAADYVMRVTSYGTSKVTLAKRLHAAKDIVIENINITDVTHSPTTNFRFGINANGADGEGIVFRNIDLNEVGSYDHIDANNALLPSYGAFARDSRGITFDNIRTAARYGFGIADSENIAILGGEARHVAHGSVQPSYGIFTSDKGAPIYANSQLTIMDTLIADYDVGVRYPLVNACQPFTVSNLTFQGVAQPEVNGACL